MRVLLQTKLGAEERVEEEQEQERVVERYLDERSWFSLNLLSAS